MMSVTQTVKELTATWMKVVKVVNVLSIVDHIKQ